MALSADRSLPAPKLGFWWVLHSVQRGSVQPGSAASQWTWLDTRLGLNTASETEGCQLEDRGNNTEVIYSIPKQDNDFGHKTTWQAETGKARCMRKPCFFLDILSIFYLLIGLTGKLTATYLIQLKLQETTSLFTNSVDISARQNTDIFHITSTLLVSLIC